MPKRVRHVVRTSEVAHLWAGQKQDSGRNSGNFYFRGNKIYSYGSHFEIARILTFKDGKQVVLWNHRTYSSSTSGHQSYVRSAISHMNTLSVSTFFDLPVELAGDRATEWCNGMEVFNNAHRENIMWIAGELNKYINLHAKARLRSYKSAILSEAVDMMKYVELFELKKRHGKHSAVITGMKVDKQLDEKLTNAYRYVSTGYPKKLHELFWLVMTSHVAAHGSDELFYEIFWKEVQAWYPGGFDSDERREERGRIAEEKAAVRDAADREARRMANIEYQKEMAEKMEAWRNGADVRIDFWRMGDDLYLRKIVRTVNEKMIAFMETSKGIRIELHDAFELFQAVCKIRERGREYTPNGHQIRVRTENAYWTIDRITAEGDVDAGCHHAKWPMIEEFAKREGWL